MKKRVLLVLSIIALAITSAAIGAQNINQSATAALNPLCDPVPTSVPNGLVPVWVQINIKAAKGDPIMEMGLAIRRYVGPNRYKNQLGLFPGCPGLKLYKPSNLPTQLCTYVPAGYSVEGGACQRLVNGFNGAKQVTFFVHR